MSKQQDFAVDEIKLCNCHLCNYRVNQNQSCLSSDIGTLNHMGDFIKKLPVGFPLIIQQTVIVHRKEQGSLQYHSYFNPIQDERKKFSIIHQTLKSINSMTCQNVQLYFKNSEKIVTKFQAQSMLASNRAEEIQYIQPYQHSPIIRIQYSTGSLDKLDGILKEYISKEMERFKHDNYKYNQEFLEWVYREYGEEIFFTFLSELSARIFKAITRGEIKSGIFFWVAERSSKDILTVQKKSGERQKYNAMQELGRPQKLNFKPKLLNVRDFKVQQLEKHFSFDDQYQSLIRERIANSTKKTISAIKNKAYRSRLDVFRSKIQQVYKQEQKKIMDGIQEEKTFEYQVDSQKMARLLIPTLGPDQNLRQVLNDEKAFREVFFSHKKDRNITTLPNLTKKYFITKKSTKKDPQKAEYSGSRVVRRYQKLLTTPSTHE